MSFGESASRSWQWFLQETFIQPLFLSWCVVAGS
jgi:hypothetical protein